MTRITTFLVAAIATMLVANAAQAQSNRTFVSGHGLDTNPCSLVAPCRSFAQAITLTNLGGEITILDPAGYGPVTITKAISIVNDGVGEAGVTETSPTINAITITAGAQDVVNLRGLTLVGGGNATNNTNSGVQINSVGTLNIQNCVIRGFGNFAVNGAGSGMTLGISDTIASGNFYGFALQPPGGVNTAVLSGIRPSAIPSWDFWWAMPAARAFKQPPLTAWPAAMRPGWKSPFLQPSQSPVPPSPTIRLGSPAST